jgi:frataxin-like iron-binding protein CyaY
LLLGYANTYILYHVSLPLQVLCVITIFITVYWYIMITPHFTYFTGVMCNNSSNYTINKQSTKRQICTSCFPYFTGGMCNNSSDYTINKQSTKRQLCTSCFPYFTGAMCNNSSNYTINKQSTKTPALYIMFPLLYRCYV